MSDFPFQPEYDAMVQALTEAKDKIKAIQKIPALSNKICNYLTKEINFLKSNSGQHIHFGEGSPTIGSNPKPLTKMFGKQLNPKPKIDETTADFVSVVREVPTAKEIEAQDLRAKVDDLYPIFTQIDSDQLLDSHDEIVVRAIAKRAGMTISEKSPKKIDTRYIDKIKAAIKTKAEKDRAGEGTDENKKDAEE